MPTKKPKSGKGNPPKKSQNPKPIDPNALFELGIFVSKMDNRIPNEAIIYKARNRKSKETLFVWLAYWFDEWYGDWVVQHDENTEENQNAVLDVLTKQIKDTMVQVQAKKVLENAAKDLPQSEAVLESIRSAEVPDKRGISISGGGESIKEGREEVDAQRESLIKAKVVADGGLREVEVLEKKILTSADNPKIPKGMKIMAMDYEEGKISIGWQMEIDGTLYGDHMNVIRDNDDGDVQLIDDTISLFTMQLEELKINDLMKERMRLPRDLSTPHPFDI